MKENCLLVHGGHVHVIIVGSRCEDCYDISYECDICKSYYYDSTCTGCNLVYRDITTSYTQGVVDCSNCYDVKGVWVNSPTCTHDLTDEHYYCTEHNVVNTSIYGNTHKYCTHDNGYTSWHD